MALPILFLRQLSSSFLCVFRKLLSVNWTHKWSTNLTQSNLKHRLKDLFLTRADFWQTALALGKIVSETTRWEKFNTLWLVRRSDYTTEGLSFKWVALSVCVWDQSFFVLMTLWSDSDPIKDPHSSPTLSLWSPSLTNHLSQKTA